MRHKVKEKKLGVRTDTRRALIKNLARNIVLYEKVKTTRVRGKVAKNYVEKLISIGKKQDLSALRQLRKFLPENAAKKVFEVLAPAFKERNGGYLRLVNAGLRKGDASKMVYIFFDQDTLKAHYAKQENEPKAKKETEPTEEKTKNVATKDSEKKPAKANLEKKAQTKVKAKASGK